MAMTPEALGEIQARFRQALARHRVRDGYDRRSVFPDDAQVLADIQWLLDEAAGDEDRGLISG